MTSAWLQKGAMSDPFRRMIDPRLTADAAVDRGQQTGCTCTRPMPRNVVARDEPRQVATTPPPSDDESPLPRRRQEPVVKLADGTSGYFFLHLEPRRRVEPQSTDSRSRASTAPACNGPTFPYP